MLIKIVIAVLAAAASTFSVASDHLYYMTQKGSMACLARAMYEEANTQPYVGRKAVVEVILNRASSSGKHVCDIIKERSQFSWVNTNTNVYKLTDSKSSEKDVLRIANELSKGNKVLDDSYKFFYAKALANPSWAGKMLCKDIHEQTFCKLKGN